MQIPKFYHRFLTMRRAMSEITTKCNRRRVNYARPELKSYLKHFNAARFDPKLKRKGARRVLAL